MATRPKTGGRKKGTKNKIPHEFRVTVQKLLEDNASNVHKWLRQVAEGTLRLHEGQLIGDPPNPGKALDLIAKLAEYAAPKLTRAEVNIPGANQGQTHIQIEFIRPPPREIEAATVVGDIVEMPRLNGHHVPRDSGTAEPDQSEIS